MTILLSDPRVSAVSVRDLGSPIDATPEQSDGPCYFAAAGIGADARAHRTLLATVLGGVGLVNYPTEWWHWSFGDRYWALATGRPTPSTAPSTCRLRHDGAGGAGGPRAGASPRAEPVGGPGGGRANTRLFAARTEGALMAVVKADGFGRRVDLAVPSREHLDAICPSS